MGDCALKQTMHLQTLLIRRLVTWLGLWALLCGLLVFGMGKQDVRTEYDRAHALIDDLYAAMAGSTGIGLDDNQTLRDQLALRNAQQEKMETRRELITISAMLLLMAAGSGVVVWLSLRPALNKPLKELVNWLEHYQSDLSKPNRTSPEELKFNVREFQSIHHSVGNLIRRLETEQTKSRTLLGRVMEVQEQERQTIAQDLHDHFGQLLTSIAVNSAFLLKHSEAQTQEAAQAIHDQTHEMMRWLRSSLRELKPHLLLEVSLRDAALDLTDNWAKRKGWFVDFVWEQGAGEFAESGKISVYRVLQEALTNAARHAASRNVKVIAGHDPSSGDFVMIVENDQVGDDAEIVPSLGLTGIRERIEHLGGTTTIRLRDGVFQLLCRTPFKGTTHAS